MRDAPQLSVDVQLRLGSLDLDLALESDAPWISIVGPSGAGKSTFLRVLAGVAPAARGTIRFQDRLWMDTANRVQIPAWDRRVGWVPQDDFLFPNRSVLKNLTYGLRHRTGPSSIPGGEVTVEEVSELLGVTHLLERFPRNLSGGERQRVALGRALLRGPALLLLDEPFAALDLPLRRTVAQSLREFTDRHDVSAVLVSHDEVGNGTLTTERWVLTQGRLEQTP
ncbi:MAG: ATP-binding cassette domain-containing protein [Longimicrobiales bacterium]